MKFKGHEFATQAEANSLVGRLLASKELEKVLTTKADIGENSLAWVDVRKILQNPQEFPELRDLFLGQYTIPSEQEMNAMWSDELNLAKRTFIAFTMSKYFVVKGGTTPISFYFHLKQGKWHFNFLDVPYAHRIKEKDDDLEKALDK